MLREHGGYFIAIRFSSIVVVGFIDKNNVRRVCQSLTDLNRG